MRESEHMKQTAKKLLVLFIAFMIAASAFIMCACTPDKDSDGDGDSLKAADPMTEEEIENDDSGGCIEDSEDLLN